MDWGIWMWVAIDAIAAAVLAGAFAHGAYIRRDALSGPAIERSFGEAAGKLYHPQDNMGNKPLTG